MNLSCTFHFLSFIITELFGRMLSVDCTILTVIAHVTWVQPVSAVSHNTTAAAFSERCEGHLEPSYKYTFTFKFTAFGKYTTTIREREENEDVRE